MSINLVVESGAGLPGANSYVSANPYTYTDGSIFGCDQYFSDRLAPTSGDNQVWLDASAENDDIKKACLIRATFFLDYNWRALFKGNKDTQQQSLCWPRIGATIDEGTGAVYYPGYVSGFSSFLIGSNEIPIQVKMCVAELAARAAKEGGFAFPGDLAPDLTSGDFVKMEKVGPIEVEYTDQATVVTVRRFCDMLLAPILRGGGGGMVPLARG